MALTTDLRLLEMGRDHFRMNTQYEVVGGYFSPVSDVYRKNGLAPSHHRYVPTALMAHADVTSTTELTD
jgi:hypothetical protein